MTSTIEIASVNSSWENHLLCSLQSLRKNDTMCNALLVTRDGKKCRAHAAVLAGASPVLRNLLQQAAPRYQIAIQMVSNGSLLEYVLDFIYRGKIQVPVNQLVDLQKAADILQIKQLGDLCRELLEGAGVLYKILDNKSPGGKNFMQNVKTVPYSSAGKVTIVNSKTNQPILPTDSINTKLNITKNSSDASLSDSEKTHRFKVVRETDDAVDLTVEKPKFSDLRDTIPLLVENVTNEDKEREIDANKTHSYGTRGVILSTLSKPQSKSEKELDIWTRKRFMCQLCPSAFTRRDNLKVHMLKKHNDNSFFTGKDAQSLLGKDRSDGMSTPTPSEPELTMDNADEERNESDMQRSLTPSPPTLTKETSDWPIKDSFLEEDAASPVLTSMLNAPVLENNNNDPKLDDGKNEKRIFGKKNMNIQKGGKRFDCTECLSTFTRLDNLKVHMRSIHAGHKPYECDICSKNFTRAFTLKYHKMSHYGQKPFRCVTCGRGFVRRDYYLEHLRNKTCKPTYDGADKINNYLEDSLEEDSMSQNEDLSQQGEDMGQNEHEGSLDNNRNYERNNMETDEEMGDEECEICHQVFQNAAALESHSDTHMEEGFYVCRLCSIHFSTAISLEFHLMQHKREDEQNAEIETVTAMETELEDESKLDMRDRDVDRSVSMASDKQANCDDKEEGVIRDNADDDDDNDNDDDCGDLNYANVKESLELLSDTSCDMLGAFDKGPSADSKHIASESVVPLTKGALLKDILLGKSKYMLSGSHLENALDLSNKHPKLDDNEATFHNNNNEKSCTSTIQDVMSNSLDHSDNAVKDMSDLTDGQPDELNSTGMSDMCEDESFLDSSSQCSSPAHTDASGSDLQVKKKAPKEKKMDKHQSTPYKCDICGAKFTRIDNMKVHVKRHNGEKDFMCVECGQAFTRKATLKKHQISAHSVK